MRLRVRSRPGAGKPLRAIAVDRSASLPHIKEIIPRRPAPDFSSQFYVYAIEKQSSSDQSHHPGGATSSRRAARRLSPDELRRIVADMVD
jgi:hypothetical protein